MRSIVVTVRRLVAIRRHQGNRGLVIFTKACTVIMMQSVARHKLSSTRPLGCAISRTRRGLLRVIPSVHRKIIRDRQGVYANILIRLYMSIFSIYRVIDFKPTLKISSIINPGVVIPGSLFMEFQRAIIGFFAYYRVDPTEFKSSLIDKISFSNLAKSSPSLTGIFPRPSKKYDPAKGIIRSSSSPLGIIMAAAS